MSTAAKPSQTAPNPPKQATAPQQSDFFASRISAMIDLRHPLAVLASRLDWDAIEIALKPSLARQVRTGKVSTITDLLGTHQIVTSAGVSPAGPPRLNTRLNPPYPAMPRRLVVSEGLWAKQA